LGKGCSMKRFRFVAFILLFVLASSAYPENTTDTPLKLTISADKENYSVGDEIKINYTIENISSEPVGFYVRNFDNLKISVRDLSDNNYQYYYDEGVQRMSPSLYPDEYILLNSYEKWKGNQSLQFKTGKIVTNESGTKAYFKEKFVYEGLYLTCPKCDAILLRDLTGGKVKVAAIFETSSPNPRNFTRQDCEKAKISLNVFPEDSESNQVHQSVVGENANLNLDNPSFEDTFNLAIYCQHNNVLSKKALLGTLSSNRITINLNTK